jgi:hypothetical protein
MNSYTLFLITANKPLFPFFTFNIEESRGVLSEAFCWYRHTLTPLTDQYFRDSFVKWCESIVEEAHHVVCVPTSLFHSVANKYIPWTSSVKVLGEQIRLLTKNVEDYVPQISKINSFLFLLDFLPNKPQERKRGREPESHNILNKKLKDLHI